MGKEYSKSADIWSLGVILFYMVYEHYPFHGPEMVRKIALGDYGKPKGGSKIIKGVLKKMLKPDPKRRVSAHQLVRSKWVKKTPSKQLPRFSEKSDGKKIVGMKLAHHLFCVRQKIEQLHSCSSSPKNMAMELGRILNLEVKREEEETERKKEREMESKEENGDGDEKEKKRKKKERKERKEKKEKKEKKKKREKEEMM